MAFLQLQESDLFRVKTLLTTISETYNRVSMHGTRLNLLELQAGRMQIPIKTITLSENAAMADYNNSMQIAVHELKKKDISTFAFGDIFLEDLRKYREEQLAKAQVTAVFPLWNRDTSSLVKELEDKGITAMIICINDHYLGKEFL